MKNKHKQPYKVGIVLAMAWVLTMAGFGLSGCATPKAQAPEEKTGAIENDLRATLESAVQDPDKRQEMQALVDQSLTNLQAGLAELAELREELGRLNKDYNATREEAEELDAQMVTVRQETLARLIASRQALANLATDDEWAKIVDRDMSLLNP